MKPNNLNQTFFVLILAVCTSQLSHAHDAETTELIKKLGSSEESDRILARQLLPREGAKVVPDILPLLGHSDANIWWTADKVLADIANEVSVPGREGERQFVSEQLMALLAPDTSNELKTRALRLLSIVVPEQFDVSPVEELLADDQLKMNARDALQLIGTSEAVHALISGLLKAEKEFQLAILDSLDKTGHINSISALRGFSAKPDPEIHATAALGLARWGSLMDLDLFKKIWQDRTPETELNSGNAFLLYADQIAAKGGNTGLAVGLYEEVFNDVGDPGLIGAAMMGMAKNGDSCVVGPLFTILTREDAPQLTPQFLNALIALRGTGANQAVVDRFQDLPENLRIQAIGIFGRKGHPVFLPLLIQLTDSENEEERSAAFTALANSKLPGGVEALATKVREGNDQALAALKSLADSLARDGKAKEAGQAYAVILDSAPDDDSRKTALAALGRFPRVESFDSVVSSLGNPEIKAEALIALTSITRALAQSNQEDRANQGFDRLMENAKSTEDLNTLGGLAKQLGRSSELLHSSGFLTRWNLIGPFPWVQTEGFGTEHIGEPNPDPSKGVEYLQRDYTWKGHESTDSIGQVNLNAIYGDLEDVVIYGLTTFEVDEAQEATLRVGSDDWIKVWLNGEAVHEFTSFRGVTLDQDQVPITLKKGTNTLLLRINQGVLGYGFVVRLTDRDGKPIAVH